MLCLDETVYYPGYAVTGLRVKQSLRHCPRHCHKRIKPVDLMYELFQQVLPLKEGLTIVGGAGSKTKLPASTTDIAGINKEDLAQCSLSYMLHLGQ